MADNSGGSLVVWTDENLAAVTACCWVELMDVRMVGNLDAWQVHCLVGLKGGLMAD